MSQNCFRKHFQFLLFIELKKIFKRNILHTKQIKVYVTVSLQTGSYTDGDPDAADQAARWSDHPGVRGSRTDDHRDPPAAGRAAAAAAGEAEDDGTCSTAHPGPGNRHLAPARLHGGHTGTTYQKGNQQYCIHVYQ